MCVHFVPLPIWLFRMRVYLFACLISVCVSVWIYGSIHVKYYETHNTPPTSLSLILNMYPKSLLCALLLMSLYFFSMRATPFEIKTDNWTHILALQHYLLPSFLMYWAHIIHTYKRTGMMKRKFCIRCTWKNALKTKELKEREKSFKMASTTHNNKCSFFIGPPIFAFVLHNRNYSMILNRKKHTHTILWHRKYDEKKRDNSKSNRNT